MKYWQLVFIIIAVTIGCFHGYAKTVVAVVDSGVDTRCVGFGDFIIEGLNLVDPDEPMKDYDDHGTPVAAIIHRIAPTAAVLPIAVARNGASSSPNMINGLIYAIEHEASIINISMSVNDNILQKVRAAVGDDRFSRTLFVVASGNHSEPYSELKESWDNVLIVAAMTLDDPPRLASYSAFGQCVDVAAPAGDSNDGLNVVRINNTVGRFNGTSAAAPVISGLAARIIDSDSIATVDILKRAILSHAISLQHVDIKNGAVIPKSILPISLFLPN